MLEVRNCEDDKLYLYINGRKCWKVNRVAGILEMVEFPPFSIKLIENIKATDFPDTLQFTWQETTSLSPIFTYFVITRMGSAMEIRMEAELDMSRSTFPWLRWNPDNLMQEMAMEARKKGHRAHACKPPGISLTMKYKTAGTLGDLIQKALKEAGQMQRDAEKTLLKLAAKSMR
jgi:hypothetical protein